MGQELVSTSAVAEDTVDEHLEARKRTHIYRHPDREYIEAMLRRGKSAWWIERWLEEQYPLDDPDSDTDPPEPHPEATQNKKLHVSEKLLKEYRAVYMPECTPGVDVVAEDLEEIVGRRFHGFEGGPPPEIEILEFALDVAQHNMRVALEFDDGLGVLSETTVEAQAALVTTAQTTVQVKQQIGTPGYEKPVERSHQTIDAVNRNLNVELNGSVDPKTGARQPTDPPRFERAMQMLAMPPEKVEAALAAAEAEAEEIVDAEEVADAPGFPADAGPDA